MRAGWRALLIALLLVSAVAASWPSLVDQLRLARQLRPLHYEQRREVVVGDLYRGVEQLRRQLDPSQRVALINSGYGDPYAGWVAYYLYPIPTKIYLDRWSYAGDDLSRRPKVIIRVAPIPQITTYEALRWEAVRQSPVISNPPLPTETRGRFAIPFVASAEGSGPNTYCIEGAVSSDGTAHLQFTMHPQELTASMTIDGTRVFRDLVYECFGRLAQGWVEVTSDRPVRAAFWLVNHAKPTASPLRLVDGPLRSEAPFPATSGAVLWLLNLSDHDVRAHVGPNQAWLRPKEQIGVRAAGSVGGPVYAYMSQKLSDGGTRFTWPEDLR